jgi:lipoyl-dependent peroxiredoxin
MPTRKAEAAWEGGLQGGNGTFRSESGAVDGSYSFGSRFAEAGGSNPEELLAAAHAACFSMAFAGQLEKAGASPTRVQTEARCSVEKQGEGFTITTMRLRSRASVSGIEQDRFQEVARAAKEGCPVSRALAGVNIELEATLE